MSDPVHLAGCQENRHPLTPLSFPERSLRVSPYQLALVWRDPLWANAAFGALAARMVAHERS